MYTFGSLVSQGFWGGVMSTHKPMDVGSWKPASYSQGILNFWCLHISIKKNLWLKLVKIVVVV